MLWLKKLRWWRSKKEKELQLEEDAAFLKELEKELDEAENNEYDAMFSLYISNNKTVVQLGVSLDKSAEDQLFYFKAVSKFMLDPSRVAELLIQAFQQDQDLSPRVKEEMVAYIGELCRDKVVTPMADVVHLMYPIAMNGGSQQGDGEA